MITASVSEPSRIRRVAMTLGPSIGVAMRVSRKPEPHRADKAASW